MGEQRFLFRPVGCSYAAQKSWDQKNVYKGVVSVHSYTQDPCLANECLYRVFDIESTPFTHVAFNEAGTLLAAATTAGVVRVIGLRTRCRYTSIDAVADAAESAPCLCGESGGSVPCDRQPADIQFMEFLDYDRKLSFVCNDYLLVYDLMPFSGVALIVRVNLGRVATAIKAFSEMVVNSIDPSTEERPPSTLQDELTPRQSGEDDRLEADSSLSAPSAAGKRYGAARKGVFPKFSSLTAFCKIIKLVAVSDATIKPFVEFIVSFRKRPQCLLVPSRIKWALESERCDAIHALIPSDITEANIGNSLKDPTVATAVFTRTLMDWTFLVDPCVCEPKSGNKQVAQRIQQHNTYVSERLPRPSDPMFSMWGPMSSSSAYKTRVFCAVGFPTGKIFIVSQHFSASKPIISGYINLKSPSLAPLQLVANRSGNLLLSRSAERLAVIKVAASSPTTEQEANSGDYLPEGASMIDTPTHLFCAEGCQSVSASELSRNVMSKGLAVG